METEKQLREEIKKWTEKLDNALVNTRPITDKGTEMFTNIRAYQSDSIHFFQKGDLVRSFEALIWAWSWIEIGKELNHLS